MKKLFRKARRAFKKVTSTKAARFALPITVGAVPYLVTKGAVAATEKGSVASRARRFGHGAAGGAIDYFRNPVVRGAAEVIPGVRPLARATERAAVVAQAQLDPRRRGPVSAREALGAGVELAKAGAAAAGVELPNVPLSPKALRTVEKGMRSAVALENGSKKLSDLRKARAASRVLRQAKKKSSARGVVRSLVRNR